MREPDPDLNEDIALLRELPAAVMRAGYVDAYLTYGSMHMRWDAMRRELSALPAPLSALVRLFALGDAVEADDLQTPLGGSLPAALERLGVLLRTQDGRLHSGGLLLLPLLGQMAFIPAPRDDPAAFFGDDTAALAARIMPARGARCLNLCAGPGVVALRAATLGERVIAVEQHQLPLGCAELNVAMNGLEDRIELRRGFGTAALRDGEFFDHVSANPPLLPFPPSLLRGPGGLPQEEGESPTVELIRLLPSVLSPRGVAQLIGADLGDNEGPRLMRLLADQSAAEDISAVLTVTGSAPLSPGSRLLRALAFSNAEASGLPPVECERRMTDAMSRAGCDRLYLFHLTLSRGAGPAGLIVSRPDTFGGGFWYR